MILNVSHSKGGVGKSSIAFNLAVELAKYNPLVIDLDVQKTLTVTSKIRFNNKLSAIEVVSIDSREEFKNFMKKNKDRLIIVDSGGYDSALSRAAISISDMIITPVSDSTVELIGLRTYQEALSQISAATGTEIKSHVLLNNIDPRSKKFNDITDFISKSKYFTIMDTILRRRSTMKKSIEVGKSCKEFDKKSKSTQEFKSLIKEIKKELDIILIS